MGASLRLTGFHPSGLSLTLFPSGGSRRCLSINPPASLFSLSPPFFWVECFCGGSDLFLVG
ncbi:hypothetical protein A2U01_0074252 [Trifolium medium]|uniref:Uncharacterized protein n=1 Tax=Trifolium medium TaxID=97028 RepID=A0A392SYP6_9FABA|nr:hypothetical protein [Trifolium medium]